MLSNLLFASIVTLGICLVNIFTRDRKNFLFYILVFFLMLLSAWIFNDKVHANETVDYYEQQYEMTEDARQEIEFLENLIEQAKNAKKLTPNETDFYKKKVTFHNENALRTYTDAKDKCWWLPDLDDRKKARYCFESLMASIAASTPQSKVIFALLTMLTNYGLDCADEWHYINNKLYWSQYHYEMAEFYQTVLDKA